MWRTVGEFKSYRRCGLERDKSCVYCGCKFGSERAKKRSWEHIINDITITGLDNIALCCVGCNASKGQNCSRIGFIPIMLSAEELMTEHWRMSSKMR